VLYTKDFVYFSQQPYEVGCVLSLFLKMKKLREKSCLIICSMAHPEVINKSKDLHLSSLRSKHHGEITCMRFIENNTCGGYRGTG
jgi:hypothetical protein